MGCTLCVKACPVNAAADKKAAAAGTKADKADYAIYMVPQATQADQQACFDYAVAKVSEKKELVGKTVKASQFKQPLLEFSGSCAGWRRDLLRADHHPALRRADVHFQRDRLFLHLGRLGACDPLYREQGERQRSRMGELPL